MKFLRLAAGLVALALLAAPAWANDLSNATWSETDASNNAAPPAGWPTGMPPNQTEATARAMMGAVKRWYDRANATLTSGGSANAQTLTYSIPPAACVAGDGYVFKAGFTNAGAMTLNNGFCTAAVQIGAAALVGGEVVAGRVVAVYYDGSVFQLLSGGVASTAQGGTGKTSTWTAGSVPFLATGTLFGEDNANFFYNGSTHRLGLGITAPVSRLQLSPALSAATGLAIGDGGAPGGFTLYQGAGANAGVIKFGNGTGYRLDFSAAGSGISIFDTGDFASSHLNASSPVSSGATALCGVSNVYLNAYVGVTLCASDARLKDLIAPLDPPDGAAAKIDKLRPSSFAWRSDEQHTLHAGFIAQDVQRVMPECVTENPDGYLSIEMPCVVAYAVKAQQDAHWHAAQLWKELILGWIATFALFGVLFWRRKHA